MTTTTTVVTAIVNQKQEVTNKARIIQNTTCFTNSQINSIIDFVNPLTKEEYDCGHGKKRFRVTEAQKSLQNLIIRIIYDSERDREFLDNNTNGHYIPEYTWRNRHGLTIIDKPVLTVILPNPNELKFPVYSNFGVLRVFERKHLPLSKRTIKQLWKARKAGGYSIVLYLSLEELLVHILAHELRHHLQALLKLKLSKTRTRNKALQKVYSEKDADRYAVRQLRLWRNLHCPKDAYPDLTLVSN